MTVPGPVPTVEMIDEDTMEDVLFLEDLDFSVEGPLSRKTVRVRGGPPVWDGKTGPVLRDDGGDLVTVMLVATDDGGPADFEVTMPRGFLREVDLSPEVG